MTAWTPNIFGIHTVLITVKGSFLKANFPLSTLCIYILLCFLLVLITGEIMRNAHTSFT